MDKPVLSKILKFLDETPPSITYDACELCGGSWFATVSNVDRYGLPVRFVMCRHCGLVCQNPRWDNEAYATFYTEYYRPLVSEWRGYPSTATSGAGALDWLRAMARTTGLDRLLPPSPRAMDIGGGTGVLAAFMRDEYGADVTVVEPNAGEAQEAVAAGFDVVTDVFENARSDDDTFDLIVMVRTVDHLLDASKTFSKIRRILKPGGYFLVDGADYFRRMTYLQDTVEPLKIDHCYYFSPESLTMLMRKNGLRSVVSDVTVLPGEIVNLARVADPETVNVSGFETLPGAEYRYFEWEQLADRPHFETRPGYHLRSLYRDVGWMKAKLASKLRKRG